MKNIKKFIISVLFLMLSINSAFSDYQHYVRPSSDKNWWARVTNKSPWLREKLNSEFNFGRSVAVVVGIGDYDEWPNLPSTVSDAKNVFHFLRDEADFDEIYFMTDRDVTLSNIGQLMGDTIPRSLGESDRFFFYWAGHGGRVKNRSLGYLPLSNGDHSGRGALDMLQPQAWMRVFSPRHALFVIDACHSGTAALSARAIDHNARTAVSVERLSRPAYSMLSSSASDESSYGYADGSGGAFTNALLSALRGNGDFYPKDGIVTLKEATLYIQVQLEKIAEINGFRFLQSAHNFNISNRETSGEFFFINPKGDLSIKNKNAINTISVQKQNLFSRRLNTQESSIKSNTIIYNPTVSQNATVNLTSPSSKEDAPSRQTINNNMALQKNDNGKNFNNSKPEQISKNEVREEHKKIDNIDIKNIIYDSPELSDHVNGCVNGNARSCSSAAGTLWGDKKFIESAALFSKGCNLNNGHSCHWLGHYFLEKTFIAHRIIEGIRLIEKGCKLGESDSCLHAGRAIFSRGWSEDRYKAVEYYHLACNAGLKEACTQIAIQPALRKK